MSVLAIARLPVVCAVLAALVALLALMGTQVHALEIAVDAQAQLEATAFEQYIDRFYPSGRTNEHAQTIEMISRGLKRRDITLTSLIQVAETIMAQAAAENVDSDDGQRGPNGCLMYNGEECNGERAGTCIDRTCHCVGQWTGLRCQSDWSIKRFNPYTGLSEANEECAGQAADFMKGC